jgi:hypothetical protein
MVAPPLYRRERLTGAVQGRVRRWSSKLVMQVQVAIETADWTSQVPIPPMPGSKMTRAEWARWQADRAAEAWKPAGTVWRDATWQDQLELSRLWTGAKRRRSDQQAAAAPAPTAPAAPSFAPTSPAADDTAAPP